MEELPEPRHTYILPRRRPTTPRRRTATRVNRDTFAEMAPPFPADAPRNRLGLAQWLTSSRPSPDGAGLRQPHVGQLLRPRPLGDPRQLRPSRLGRPATRNSSTGLLATSSITAGMSNASAAKSSIPPRTNKTPAAGRELHKRDPDNLLLARGPEPPLSAERLRDFALAASDLLTNKHGRPARLPLPARPGPVARSQQHVARSYTQSTGEGLRRRSLYSVWKRTAPLPNMLVFDATSRKVCTISRGRTRTRRCRRSCC